MKFYNLTNAYEKKEIGHYPQVLNVTWDGKPYDQGAFGTQGLFSAVHTNPAIPTLEFYKSTKITSIIDMPVISTSKYLIVNGPFLEFLKSYTKSTYQTWNIKATRKEEQYDYTIFFVDHPEYNFINYEKSVFKLFKQDEKYNKIDLNTSIPVVSDQDLMDKVRQYPPIGIEKPFLAPVKLVVNGSTMQADFFRSVCTDMPGYFVSEKLKNEIIKQGFTGMRFEELSEINKFVTIEVI